MCVHTHTRPRVRVGVGLPGLTSKEGAPRASWLWGSLYLGPLHQHPPLTPRSSLHHQCLWPAGQGRDTKTSKFTLTFLLLSLLAPHGAALPAGQLTA